MKRAFVECVHNDSLILVDVDLISRHGPELTRQQAKLAGIGGIGWKTLEFNDNWREIIWSYARLGNGPVVYDELLARTNGYVIPSREHVSRAARQVWHFYVYRRDDVNKFVLPIEIPKWASTAPELDHGFKLIRQPMTTNIPTNNLTCCDWHDLVFSMFQTSLDRD